MKITLSGSLAFTNEIKGIARKLEGMGHEVTIPMTSKDIIDNKVTLEKIMQEKEDGSIVDRGMKIDAIRRYYHKIKESDGLLVVNMDKNSIKNYIGGATLIEMGFAHALEKGLFLLNGIPEMKYTDEIKIMNPVVLNGDLERIGKE